MSFAEIQQLQSQPSNAAIKAKERRSLKDIQAEEAELQAEAEFLKWWTAEEERIRLENEATAASLLQPQKQQQQQRPHHRHYHGRRNKKSAATAAATEGESTPGPRTSRGGDQKSEVVNLSYCCYLPEIDGKGAMSCFENPQYVCRVSEIEKRTACT